MRPRTEATVENAMYRDLREFISRVEQMGLQSEWTNTSIYREQKHVTLPNASTIRRVSSRGFSSARGPRSCWSPRTLGPSHRSAALSTNRFLRVGTIATFPCGKRFQAI
jgi:hypothetical protein